MLRTIVVGAVLCLAFTSATRADKFGSASRGMRCYTGNLLAELRARTASGDLKKLPKDLRTLVSSADTLAIIIDHRPHENEMTVGYVEQDNSKVMDHDIYKSGHPAYRLLEIEFPKMKK